VYIIYTDVDTEEFAGSKRILVQYIDSGLYIEEYYFPSA
jgi:hypothetical protein